MNDSAHSSSASDGVLKRIPQLFAILAFLLLSGDGTRAQEFGGSISCESDTACRIEYDHLSSQKTDPFLFLGRPMDRQHPRWRQYRRALRRYPGVRDCLVEVQQDREAPNLLLIDWQRVGVGPSADVCIFRIARSLDTVERIQDWLDFHGFNVYGPKRIFSESYVPRNENDRVGVLAGNWTREQFRDTFPSWFERFTGLEIARGFSVNIQFSQENLVVGSMTNVRTK